MSFSPENFSKKLASLQETQDLIVTISQWVLFHHRHVKELALIWEKFTLQPHESSKRLYSLYLCNDVVQQARAKRKPEFIAEFARVLPNVFNQIYSKLDARIQPKVERLINVWEQRKVFDGEQIKKLRLAIALSKSNKPLADEAAPAPAKESIAPELKHLNNTFLHLNQLIESSQANLTQVGVQSRTYLPTNPGESDNLPSPKIYISKLNMLEKLCNISKKNIDDIKADRREVVLILDNLKKLIVEGLTTDNSKVEILNQKLAQLNTTRSELQELLNEDEVEEPSPAFDNSPLPQDEDDDALPTYTNDDDEENDPSSDDDAPPAKRVKTDADETPKKVVFSDQVQVQEYDREERTEGEIKIVRSDSEPEEDGDEEDVGEVSTEYELHHKDDVELKHAKQANGYEPGEGYEPAGAEADAAHATSVLDLLSKLR